MAAAVQALSRLDPIPAMAAYIRLLMRLMVPLVVVVVVAPTPLMAGPVLDQARVVVEQAAAQAAHKARAQTV
jgi:hypothetical protein